MYHTFTFISILVVIKTTLSFTGFQNSEMQIRQFYKKKKKESSSFTALLINYFLYTQNHIINFKAQYNFLQR